jgi:hypothetical protein
MSYQQKIRTKLQNKIFSTAAGLAKTGVFISKTSPIYNTRGELESTTDTTGSLTFVPYNIISESISYQPFGTLNPGEMDAAVPYGVTIHIGDEVTVGSDNFTVTEVDNNYLPENVVTIIRLTKLIA